MLGLIPVKANPAKITIPPITVARLIGSDIRPDAEITVTKGVMYSVLPAVTGFTFLRPSNQSRYPRRLCRLYCLHLRESCSINYSSFREKMA